MKNPNILFHAKKRLPVEKVCKEKEGYSGPEM